MGLAIDASTASEPPQAYTDELVGKDTAEARARGVRGLDVNFSPAKLLALATIAGQGLDPEMGDAAYDELRKLEGDWPTFAGAGAAKNNNGEGKPQPRRSSGRGPDAT